MQKPAFSIAEFLRPTESGAISFSSAMADAYFSNISIIKENKNKTLAPLPKEPLQPLKNYVLKWQVSQSFSAKDLAKTAELAGYTLTKMTWQPLSIDSYGVLNLARIQGINKTQNTAFAQFSINSDKSQRKALHFGYSDKVKVFVNNNLVYEGNNQFRSRDYRYLGTMGLFDTIYLPLKAGKNDITFAVSERFGGWGVMASFDNCDGIQPC